MTVIYWSHSSTEGTINDGAWLIEVHFVALMYTGGLAFCGNATSLCSTSKSWWSPFWSISTERETSSIYSGAWNTEKNIPERWYFLCRTSPEEKQMPSTCSGLQLRLEEYLHLALQAWFPVQALRDTLAVSWCSGPPSSHPTYMGWPVGDIEHIPIKLCDYRRQFTNHFCIVSH